MSRAPYRPGQPLDGLTRRGLLRASCGAGVAAALAATAGCSISDVFAGAARNPLPAGTPILVLVTLYGGNDGLNTVVPYADSAYHDARPELAYAADKVLDLGSGLGLNPALKGLKSLWDEKHLAIVRGVGYPQPDRSHFRSMDIWQTAVPDHAEPTGWLGRWLDTTPTASADPLQALVIGSTLPPMLVGASRAGSALEVGAGRLPADRSALLRALGASDGADTETMAAVAQTYADALGLDTRLVTALRNPGPAADLLADESSDPVGDRGNAGNLGAQFQTVAACIRAGAPTRVYSVSLGGFDTHAGEKEAHEALLGALDAALTRFRAALAGHERASDVVVVAYSEFGRRVHANASQGTDHGTASDVFLIGDRVRGGFHGEQPSLTSLDNGDLKATTDFRAVYAALAHSVLGVDPGSIIAKAPAPLDLFT